MRRTLSCQPACLHAGIRIVKLAFEIFSQSGADPLRKDSRRRDDLSRPDHLAQTAIQELQHTLQTIGVGPENRRLNASQLGDLLLDRQIHGQDLGAKKAPALVPVRSSPVARPDDGQPVPGSKPHCQQRAELDEETGAVLGRGQFDFEDIPGGPRGPDRHDIGSSPSRQSEASARLLELLFGDDRPAGQILEAAQIVGRHSCLPPEGPVERHMLIGMVQHGPQLAQSQSCQLLRAQPAIPRSAFNSLISASTAVSALADRRAMRNHGFGLTGSIGRNLLQPGRRWPKPGSRGLPTRPREDFRRQPADQLPVPIHSAARSALALPGRSALE